MLTAFLVPALAYAGSPVVVDLIPDSTQVDPGEQVTVDVVVSDLGAGAPPSLGAFDVRLTFEPSLFELVHVVTGLDLGDLEAGETVEVSTPNPGSYDPLVLSLLPPADLIADQGEMVILFSATFQAMGSGAGEFDLELLAPLADELGH